MYNYIIDACLIRAIMIFLVYVQIKLRREMSLYSILSCMKPKSVTAYRGSVDITSGTRGQPLQDVVFDSRVGQGAPPISL